MTEGGDEYAVVWIEMLAEDAPTDSRRIFTGLARCGCTPRFYAAPSESHNLTHP
jgi:hypothetical protein